MIPELSGEKLIHTQPKEEKPPVSWILPEKCGPLTRKVFDILTEFPAYTAKQVASALGRAESEVKTVLVALRPRS
jgi:hypothetical protein